MAGYLPDRDAELANFATTMSTKLSASASTYGVSTVIAAQLATDTAAFKAALAVTSDPSTRTKPATLTKRNAKLALVAIIRSVAKIVYGTPSLSDTQRQDLGLPPMKPWTPIQAPTSAPKATIVSVNGSTVVMKLDNADVTKRARPKGVQTATVMSFVGTQPPQHYADWKLEGTTSTVSKITVQFPTDTPPFTRVWLCAYWLTARGLNGPACAPVSVNLGSWLVQSQAATGPTTATATLRAA